MYKSCTKLILFPLRAKAQLSVYKTLWSLVPSNGDLCSRHIYLIDMSDLPPSRFISRLDILGRGATAWAFKLDQDIALKYVRKGRLKEFQAENEMYDLFEKHRPSPYIVHSFFRLPGLNFMQLMSSGLDQRIYSNQRREARNLRCLEVLRLEPTPQVEQWAMELSGALA